MIGIDPVSGRQRLLASGGMLGAPTSIAVAPDGTIYVGDREAVPSRTVVRIDPDTRAQRRVVAKLDDNPAGLGLAPAGRLIVAGGGSNVHIVDPVNGRTEKTVSNDSFVDVGQAVAMPSQGLPPIARQPEPKIVPRNPDVRVKRSASSRAAQRCKELWRE